MANRKVDVDVVKKVMDILEKEFQALLSNPENAEDYRGYKIIITNEQQYVKKDPNNHKTIYLVVKFLEGTKDYGQERQPIAIRAITEYNGIEVCQKLLMDFSESYNLIHNFTFINEENTSYSVKQTVSTVSNLGNFNEIYEGYRSVFYVSGTFLIGVNSNPVVKLEVAFNDGHSDIVEEIQFISFQYSYDAQTDSQPFYGTNNFNRTVNKIGTLSVGFTMYAINSNFYNFITALVFNDIFEHLSEENGNVDYTIPSINIDHMFTLKIYFRSNPALPRSVPMKLVNVANVQELRDFPAASITFVR